MKQILSFALALCALLFIACNSEKPADTPAETTTTETTPPPAEFADAKYAGLTKSSIAAMASGDTDAMLSNFADNAVWVWNNGDSLTGKTAIADYWKKRRAEVIESIAFSNEIWLPVKVNQPQSVEQPGVWVLGWYQTTAKYKTGKSMTQWIHTDYHFDASDKIDRVIQYLDRAAINAATAK
jgi:ketosteroid isomerase-like protein